MVRSAQASWRALAELVAQGHANSRSACTPTSVATASGGLSGTGIVALLIGGSPWVMDDGDG